VLAAGALALAQGRAYWRALDRSESPLDGFAARPEPRPPRLARRVVLLILDGLRVDQAREMTTLGRLRAGGAERILLARFPSTSIPQYYAALSGIDPEISGARTNRYRGFSWHLGSVVGRAREAGLRLATVGPHRPWFTPTFGRLFGFAGFGNDHYQDNLRAALAARAELTLVIDDRVDQAGHRYGGRSVEYGTAAVLVDGLVAQVAHSLDLAHDALLVTADHGHRDAGGHGGDEPEVVQVPLVAVGAGIRPGQYDPAEMIDLGPTLSALLGLAAPAGSRGRPLSDLLALPPASRLQLDQAATLRRADVESFLATRMRNEAARAAGRRRLRLGLLLGVLIGLAFALRGVRPGVRGLGCGVAYLGVFLLASSLAGARLSLSCARSEPAVVLTLGAATLCAGMIYLLLARRSRRARGAATGPVPELLSAAVLAATPWLLALGVVGTEPGPLLPSPAWTAMGLWAGIPLICFVPCALIDMFLTFYVSLRSTPSEPR